MYRFARIMMVTVGMVILAWVIKEVLGGGEGKKSDDMVQKMRMNGI